MNQKKTRVADEVKEKRLQKMQVLEKPKGSARNQLPGNSQCVRLEKQAISTWRWNNSQESKGGREGQD